MEDESVQEVLQPPTASCEVWAVPFSLATTQGISDLISFPQLLRCFSSLSDLLASLLASGEREEVFLIGERNVELIM